MASNRVNTAYNDSIDGHPLIDVARRMLEVVFKEMANRAVQNGQAASTKDYRPSQEEAMGMMAVPLAAILNTRPELSRWVNGRPQSGADSYHLHPSTEDTRSPTPATSGRDHVTSINQDLSPQTTTALQPPEITHQTPFADTDGDQQCRVFPGMAESTQPETPSMVFLETPSNDILARPQPAATASRSQVYIHVSIEPPTFEVTLAGCKAPGYVGPQQWNILAPAGLMVRVEHHQGSDQTIMGDR